MKAIGHKDIIKTVLRLQTGKIYKSNGIWVSKSLHRKMKLGNAARDQENWDAAARYFKEAVAIDETIAHIWIQLGHALNNIGEHQQGLEAYQRALALDPSKGECHLHIGRWLVRNGDFDAAIEAYKLALQFDDVSIHAEHELTSVRPSFNIFLRQRQAVKMIATGERSGLENVQDKVAPVGVTLSFDVSDLIAHFRNNKYPTGIQRVQIEVVSESLRKFSERTEIFFFIDGIDHFIYLDHQKFVLLTTLCKENDQESWVEARDDFFACIPFSRPYLPPNNAIVINLGTSWWMYNYFLSIRNFKRERNITFIAYVHDLIPALKPEYCVEGVAVDYNTWLVGIFFHADAFITNSVSTTSDLIYAARVMGHRLAEQNIKTIPLNASFSKDDEEDVISHEALIHKWNLQARGYVLFVSTIEARKNHEAAFLTWQKLLHKHGPDAVPPLVCVGKLGWLNDRAMSIIENKPSLRSKIIFIQRASDLDLKALYRFSLFTVYPSHYEGWGLPITESLSYGRVPLIANNSSLVEAASGYGIVFESGNIIDFTEKAEKLLFDTKFRMSHEQRIAEQYSLTTWYEMMNTIVSFSDHVRLHKGTLYERFPHALAGRYVPLNLHRNRTIWRGIASGEMYRMGEQWLWPDPTGCRIKRGVAELCIPNLDFAVARIFLHIQGLDSKSSTFYIHNKSGLVFSGKTNAGQAAWAVFDMEVDEEGCVCFNIRSDEFENIVMNHGGTPKHYAAGVSVLGFCASNKYYFLDRLDFIENVSNNTIENVDCFAEN